MPPSYLRAYVKRNENDAADAEAICEAVGRPTMRFVPIKTTYAQSTLMLHRARHLLVCLRFDRLGMTGLGATIVGGCGRDCRKLAEQLLPDTSEKPTRRLPAKPSGTRRI